MKLTRRRATSRRDRHGRRDRGAAGRRGRRDARAPARGRRPRLPAPGHRAAAAQECRRNRRHAGSARRRRLWVKLARRNDRARPAPRLPRRPAPDDHRARAASAASPARCRCRSSMTGRSSAMLGGGYRRIAAAHQVDLDDDAVTSLVHGTDARRRRSSSMRDRRHRRCGSPARAAKRMMVALADGQPRAVRRADVRRR